MLKLYSVFILLLTTALHTHASMVPIDISKQHYQIGLSVVFHKDDNQIYNIENITEAPDSVFKPVNHAVSSQMFTNSVLFYKFTVNNPLSTPVNRLLMFETPWLDQVKVKTISPNQTSSDYRTGNIYPFKERAIDDPCPSVEHAFEPGITTVYVEVTTRDPFIVPISIISKNEFYKHRVENLMVTTFLYGIILSMVLYHLILFSSIRLEYYGFYVLYLSSFVLMNASYNNYTYQFLLGDFPAIQTWLQSTTIFLFAIAGLLFARSFLNLKTYLPWAQKGINALIVISIATMVFSTLLGYHIHVILSIFTAVLFSLYVFTIALLSLKKGNRTARFFFFGTATGLIGTVITALTVTAIIPYSHMGYRAIDFGMVIDCILLSFALVDRVRVTEQEKKQALKASVTDELTNLPNRRAYNSVCQQEKTDQNRIYHKTLSAMMIDIDHFKEVNDVYGHDIGDQVLQEVATTLRKTITHDEYIFRLGGEEFLVLLPDMPRHTAKLTAERIRTAIEGLTIQVGEHTIKITVSIGLSDHKADSNCIHSTEKSADNALYKAKKFGRNQVVFSSDGLV